MAKAVQALQRKEVERIILTRPAVEAGERLGFLPGTLTDKIDPYLRPLYDALNEMMDPELVPKLLAAGTVEVAPLAYMRGRTLNNAFVVLDEAQNTTPEQMKMFLTRLGFGTRMVVTGDITQIDLPTGTSGLRLVTHVLDEIDDIHFATLTSEDVVRHTLVGRIVDAYTKYDEEKQAAATSATQDADGGNRAAASRSRARRTTRPRAPSVRAGGADVSIEINNESGAEVDEGALQRLAIFALDHLHVHPDAELAILLVDEAAMEQLHVQWMDEPGPTDVLSFPMDELRPGSEDEVTPAGLLGDIVLCPQVAIAQAETAGHSPMDEMLLLTAHGILHLLGFDHAEPDDEKEMFGIQRDILVGFTLAERRR